MTGYFHLAIDSRDRFIGGWCLERGSLLDGLEAIAQHLHRLVPMTWIREEPAPPFPPWAVGYFRAFGTG
ncbi:hypothetical protein [Sorangium sp. So ce233]|uniref:hypothetical protein n=1 Tax=Sorangium sp. So ce233 TaxID=3133290 RepID=UPI003F63E69E